MRHLVFGLVVALLLSLSIGASGSGSQSPMAFIPGSMSNSIAVIDTGRNQVAATFDIWDNGANATPFGVAVSPDGLRVFVSNFMSGNVVVIDAKTHGILAEIPVGVFPTGIAIDPKGERVYVATSGDGNLSVIDASNYSRIGSPICLGAVVRTRCVGSIPRGVAVDPKAPRVYVTNKNGGGAVVVVDTVSLGIQKVIVGGEPLGIAVAPDGSRLYVGLNATGQVAVLNTADYSLIGGISVGRGPFGLALSLKDGRLYVANEVDGTVSVIDTGLLQVMGKPIPVGTNPTGLSPKPRGLSVTEDGKHVYVANWGIDSVSVIDTGSLTVAEIDLVTGRAPIAFGNSITPGVAAIDVAIDIKPGSGQHTINLGSHGVTPVAILSTSTFNAPVRVNPATVTLAGAPVQLKGDGVTAVIEERDVNGDGLVDLVVHVRTDAMVFSPGDTTAVLEGKTWDDESIRGEGTVRIVPSR